MKTKPRIITLGRQFGAGGHSVAAAISGILNIPVYDNELISKAAEESGFSAQLFAKKDEKRSAFSFSSFFTSGRYSMADNYISDNELFKIQGDVIKKLADEGPAIFIGRCSDVFICAPLEERVKCIMKRENLSYDDAMDMAQRKDRTRKVYYDFFTFGEWGAASNYDLCIDSSILGIEGTAQFIVDFMERMGK